MIDTHTHLYLEEFQPSPEDAVQRAIDAGVEQLIFPNVDLSTIQPMKSLHAMFPKNTFMAMGLHPTEIKDTWQEDLSLIEHEFNSGTKYIAVGEVGIDLYWDKTYRHEQHLAFDAQLQWASDKNLPVIIHCREGLDDILDIMDSRKGRLPQCVFHSFGGTIDDVERIRHRGDFYFGINGIVTFKNSKLRDVLSTIGIERILLETDAPYLAPVPHRGKRNESTYIIHTAAHIATTLGLTLEQVNTITSDNARALFKL